MHTTFHMDLWNSCNFEATNGKVHVVGLKKRKAKRERNEIYLCIINTALNKGSLFFFSFSCNIYNYDYKFIMLYNFISFQLLLLMNLNYMLYSCYVSVNIYHLGALCLGDFHIMNLNLMCHYYVHHYLLHPVGPVLESNRTSPIQ